MKKIICLMLLAVLMLTGCAQTSDLLEQNIVNKPEITLPPEMLEEVETPRTTIHISETLQMTNDWTIIGDYDYSLTKKGKKDRIVLATSAKNKNGEILWDDSQYWTLAVITEGGAYNLFSQRMQGYVYLEVGEIFVQGLSTPAITAYIFSGSDREIRNYLFEDGMFVEYQEYSTKQFSTGGINNRYSTIPEPKKK